MLVTRASVGPGSKSGSATAPLWSHHWKLKSSGKTGINQVINGKGKWPTLIHDMKGKVADTVRACVQRIKPGQGALLGGGDKELRSEEAVNR